MSLGDHLDELRRRVFHAAIGLLPVFIIALIYGKQLVDLILQPAYKALERHHDAKQFILTGPLEGFSTYMKVSLIAAVLVGSPWILYQFWKFVSPGLYSHERRFVYFLIPLSTVLTIVAMLFLFFIIMPLLMTFFLEFNSGLGQRVIEAGPLPAGVVLGNLPVLALDPPPDTLHVGDAWVNSVENLLRICVAIRDDVPTVISSALHTGVGTRSEYRIVEYFSLLTTLMLAFGVAFQAPVIVLLLGWAGIVDQAVLKKFRKHAILVCAIAAAMLTPGDPASMILMLLPLYFLYELGGILLRIFPASRVAGRRPAAQPEESPDDVV